MTLVRYRLSSAVTPLFLLTAIILPARASAQLASHATRISSSAVANQTDSLPVSAIGSGTEVDDTPADRKTVDVALR